MRSAGLLFSNALSFSAYRASVTSIRAVAMATRSMSSNERQAPIAIVGAGPAGLMLARLLEKSQVPFKIFERDENPDDRQESGTLDVHPKSGQLALKAAGLLDDFNALARHGIDTTVVNDQAKVLLQLGGKDDKERPEIDRKDLQRILQNSVPLDRIQWGSKIREVQKDGTGAISIHMENNTVESGFRLIVGADGAWSKVRQLFTTVKPEYAGITFFTTYIKPGDLNYASAASIVKDGNYLAMNGTQKIFIYSLRDKSYFLSVGLKLSEAWKSDRSLLDDASKLWQSLLREPFAQWTPQLTNLIQESQGSFRSWPLYNMPPKILPWKSLRGATLVGDSAHLTVPTGEGVNNAMFDSLELAQQIVKHGVDNLDQAVLEYEKTMLPRAAQAIQKGQWTTDKLFGPGAPYSFFKAIGVDIKEPSS